MYSHIDFGYPWQFVYGHLILTGIMTAILGLGVWRKWSKFLLVPIGAIAIWAAIGFVLVRFGFDMNGRGTLPTQSFLASGSGKVLDMGAGTGRSTIMVLEGRPHTTVVALDSFSESYVEHFGDKGKPNDVTDVGRERLLANLRAAGVEQRVTIQPCDMRQMPLPPASFDGIISAYSIDHLDSAGIRSSLSEASRVLKPGGEFLIMLIAKDVWLKFTFGPLLLHAATRTSSRWAELLNEAGLDVVEKGTRPATLYFLAKKR